MKYQEQNSSNASSTSTSSTRTSLHAPLTAGVAVADNGDMSSLFSELGNTMGGLPTAGQGNMSAIYTHIPLQAFQQNPLGVQAQTHTLQSILSGSHDQRGQPSTIASGDASRGRHSTAVPVVADQTAHSVPVTALTATHNLPMVLPKPPSRVPSMPEQEASAVPEGPDDAALQSMMDQYIATDDDEPVDNDSSPYSNDLSAPPSPFDLKNSTVSPSMAFFQDALQNDSAPPQHLSHVVPVTEGHNVASTSSVPPPPIPGSSTGYGSRKLVRQALPLDAPVQKRTYLTPSATSRREILPSLKRKRDDDDDSQPERSGIERKRHQNTMAARRSRQRRAERIEQLEAQIKSVTAERDAARRQAEVWKAQFLLLLSASASASAST